jgi:hypothetical protein
LLRLDRLGRHSHERCPARLDSGKESRRLRQQMFGEETAHQKLSLSAKRSLAAFAIRNHK